MKHSTSSSLVSFMKSRNVFLGDFSPLLSEGVGIAVAVTATLSVKTALYVSVTTIIAVTLASALTSLTSDYTNRVGQTIIYISLEACVFAVSYALSCMLFESYITTAPALILSAVSTFVISCHPDSDAGIRDSLIKTLIRALGYGISLLIISFVRQGASGIGILSTPSGVLILMGLLSATLSYANGRVSRIKKSGSTKETDGNE